MICINKYDRYYFEKYALLSICHLLDLNIEDFEHKDRPDLQSETLNMGIEVVRAITEHDGLVNSLVGKYFNKGVSGDEVIDLINKNNRQSRFKGSVYSVNGIAVLSDTKGLYNIEKHNKLIKEKIQQKSLLSEHYKRYKVNGLYCFAHTSWLNESGYSDIIDECKRSAFNLVFINCEDTILQWDASLSSFTEHEVSKCLAEWKQSAEKMNV